MTTLTFNKIDHGVIPSPGLGLEELFDQNSPERFRALCIEQLKRVDTHSFVAAEIVLKNVNGKLNLLPEWKREVFSKKYFEVDEEFIEKAIKIRNHNDEKYLYLKEVFDYERNIQSVIEDLAKRSNIKLKTPITQEHFFNLLKEAKSPLIQKSEKEYIEALNGQAEVCQKIFNKPLSVIAGPAGTGKTTILKALIKAIEKVSGEGSAIYLMAPTGKASERIKEKTGRTASTIHSFLASNRWLNDNFSLKREGGNIDENVSTLIIDECSMLALALFATLFKAINWNSIQRLILVGDPNQLPPIGKGKVFSEIIEWMRKNYPENLGLLNINVRQLENKVLNQGNGILDLAELFIQEKQKDSNYNKKHKEQVLKRVQEGGDIDKDLRIVYWKDIVALETKLKDVIIKDLETDSGEKLKDDKVYLLWNKSCKKDGDISKATYQQVISPVRSEYYGVDNLNIIFQSLYNNYQSKKTNLDGIALYDKVIQFRNRPKSNQISVYNIKTRKPEYIDIYNGEIGFVKPHPFDKDKWKSIYFVLHKFQVVFDRKGKLLGRLWEKFR